MNEIFKKIEGREWDWFGVADKSKKEVSFEHGMLIIRHSSFASILAYSLADLLANKSWCKAVWGKLGELWYHEAMYAFGTLITEGHEKAIEYIKKTMK